ncbi:CBS domain-containing protein [Chryseolinea lacunae]|uniref:CBS domain-containing protein n=1 Tax=Chryseolinea lacunae TaxID=2801331 RepID=A0ABS1KZJ2_9BACT|nr:CBS domain-containing protein [Chryseolinea lacunae]MBL0744880.1 CBS domain-containing protein [Chryseolinea lacunae]
MGKVNDILQGKGRNVFSVDPDTMVYSAIELMCAKNIGGLMIVEHGKLVGIFTERDYARKLILKGKSSKDTPIKELMTHKPFTVTPENSIEECMGLMTAKHIRHLPVEEDGVLVGMISIGDVVKFVIEEQKNIIEHLESYISR